jgi:type I restriction enzyme S subunit
MNIQFVPSKVYWALFRTQYQCRVFVFADVFFYFSKEISRIITEGTMKTAYLKDINHIKCPLPSMAQQKNITNLTSSIEEKLSIEQELLRFLNLQKQYLLRRMFI